MTDRAESDKATTRDTSPAIVANKLHVVIATGDRAVYDGYVEWLIAPSMAGQVMIGAHHAAMLAILDPGEVTMRDGEDEETLAIGGGFVEVRDGTALMLADTAERPEDIDVSQAEEAERRAQEAMARYRGDPRASEAFMQLRRSRARLRVARKASRPR